MVIGVFEIVNVNVKMTVTVVGEDTGSGRLAKLVKPMARN
jgi:hypothetical protein